MLKIGNRYKIKISSGNNVLTYSCEVLATDTNFVKIRDKFGNIETLSIYSIISYEEVKNE